MMPWCYAHSGLSIVSAFEIPEWTQFALEEVVETPDAVIKLDPTRYLDSENSVKVTPDELLFTVSETATYWVRAGFEITVCPAPGAGWREVRLFLLGSAWSALCYQRDILVLHASAVRIGDRAVAFCGAPGQGKSSLAACLVARGCSFVSDDLCRIDLNIPGRAMIYPSTPRLKLRSDMLARLGRQDDRLEPDHVSSGKVQQPIPGADRAPVALRAIYLLTWGDLNILKKTGSLALSHLVKAATFRPEFLEPMGKLGVYWQQCLALSQRVPVWQFQRPRDLNALDDTVHALLEHLATEDDA